jgi:hypothetical protein
MMVVVRRLGKEVKRSEVQLRDAWLRREECVSVVTYTRWKTTKLHIHNTLRVDEDLHTFTAFSYGFILPERCSRSPMIKFK